MDYVAVFAGIALLVGVSFFFSFSETALLSLSRFRIRFMADKIGRRAEMLQVILDDPERVLAPILLGNTLVNTANAVLVAHLVTMLISDGLIRVSSGTAIIVADIILTVVILVGGEITPKAIAFRNPEKYALGVIRPVKLTAFLLSPLVFVSLRLGRMMIRLITRGRSGTVSSPVSMEELRAIIDHHADRELIPSDSLEMIHNLFEFPTIPVRHIMTPRHVVRLMEEQTTPDRAAQEFIGCRHSVIPVYRRSHDNILGAVYVWDLFRDLLGQGRPRPGARSIRKLVRPVPFIPETSSVADVLRQFQETRQDFAVVVDELGQFEGVVTREDILSEIVGKLGKKEGGGSPPSIRKTGPDEYLIDGLLPVRDFNRYFLVPIPADDRYATLGGFVMSRLGRIPSVGDRQEWESYSLAVEEMAGHRVKSIRMKHLTGNWPTGQPSGKRSSPGVRGGKDGSTP